MEFKQLESFAAVVRLRSFTRAAEQLYISQPTLSTHIRALEEELNMRLILRTTKSIEVTMRAPLGLLGLLMAMIFVLGRTMARSLSRSGRYRFSFSR